MRVATFDSEPEVAELSLALEDGVTKNSKKVATKLVERVLKFLEMPSSESDVLKEEVQRDLLVAEKEERWMDVDKLTELKTLVSLASISSEAPITQTFSRLALRLREELGMAVPDNFKCAMTGEVMRDPVTLVETGDTYNRNAIENFFAKGKRVCPKSGKHLKSVELVCNVEIRKGIEESYDTLNRKTLDEASRILRDGMEQRASDAAAAAEARAAALAAGGEAAEAILAEEAAKAEEERKKEEEKKAAAKKKKKGPEPPPKEEPKEASGGEREEEAVEAMQQLSSQDKKYAAQLAEIGAVVPLVRLVTERGAGPVREGTVTVLRNIASLGEAEAVNIYIGRGGHSEPVGAVRPLKHRPHFSPSFPPVPFPPLSRLQTTLSDAGGIPPMIHLITHDTPDVTPAIQVVLELSRFPALRGAVTDAMGVVEMIKLLNWHQEDEKGALLEAVLETYWRDDPYVAIQMASVGMFKPLVVLLEPEREGAWGGQLRGAVTDAMGVVEMIKLLNWHQEDEKCALLEAVLQTYWRDDPYVAIQMASVGMFKPLVVLLEPEREGAWGGQLLGAVTDAMGVVEMIKLLNWHQEDEKCALLEAVLETYWRDDPYVAIQMASVGMFKPLVVLLEPGGLWVCRKEEWVAIQMVGQAARRPLRRHSDGVRWHVQAARCAAQTRNGSPFRWWDRQRDDPYVAIQMASVGMFKPLVVLLKPGIPYVAIQMASVGMFKPSSSLPHSPIFSSLPHSSPPALPPPESDMETRMTMADGVMTWGVNKAHRVSLVQCGVLPPLVALLNDGPPEGKAAAARAIEHLSHTDLNRMALAKAGVIPALVKALARGSPEVKNAAQATLANLAMDDQDLDALDEDGTAVRLITMLRAGPQTNRDYAVRTLECMAKESKSMRAAVMEDDGAVTAIFEVLQESASHFAAGSLRSSALLLLGHLCQEHNAAEMMCAPPEVVKTLATLLARPLPGEEREAIVIVLGTMAGNKQMRPLVRVEEQVFTLMQKFMNLNPGAGPASSSGPGSSNAASSARLQEAILSGLSKLADPDDIEAQQIVARLGVIHLAVHYLKMGPDVMRIPSAVLLGNLSHSTPKLVDQTSLDRRLGKAMTWKLNFSRSNSRASASTGGTGSGASPVTTGTDKLRSCKVHGGKCSLESTFCLVEGDIVPILLELVRRSENRVAEVCLASVATLLEDEGDHERAADLLVKLDVIEAAAGVVGRTKELTKWAVFILEKVFAIKKYRAPKYSQPAVTALGRFMTTATGQGRKTAAETLMRLNILPKGSFDL
ncbi:unnamed protein product [Closterium sp. Naga37s-1]|nr:unnamed protein product [Closterium sp. Naga37s-1]